MLKEKFFGNKMEKMPDFAYRIMAFIFKFREWFSSPGRLLDAFHIQKGSEIVDYGCGPGLYLNKASDLVGAEGKVYAVDIHELAISDVNRRAKKENLTNVVGVVADGHDSGLAPGAADLIYALDMFHMINDTGSFLGELRRIIKKDGVLYIDNGHQKREAARKKILDSGKWSIDSENKRFMKCLPRNAGM
ncbi:MAG: class I SAM-dependent methyltransferase [Desulfobacterales bacterium]|nr:class I SAM-dependent methyltransferase [Desulfobacterales bacterium]